MRLLRRGPHRDTTGDEHIDAEIEYHQPPKPARGRARRADHADRHEHRRAAEGDADARSTPVDGYTAVRLKLVNDGIAIYEAPLQNAALTFADGETEAGRHRRERNLLTPLRPRARAHRRRPIAQRLPALRRRRRPRRARTLPARARDRPDHRRRDLEPGLAGYVGFSWRGLACSSAERWRSPRWSRSSLQAAPPGAMTPPSRTLRVSCRSWPRRPRAAAGTRPRARSRARRRTQSSTTGSRSSTSRARAGRSGSPSSSRSPPATRTS